MPQINQYEEQSFLEESYQAALRSALGSGEADAIGAWVQAHEDVPFLAFDRHDTDGPVLTRPHEWTYALGQRSVAIVIGRGERSPLIVGPADIGQLALIKSVDRAPERTNTVQW